MTAAPALPQRLLAIAGLAAAYFATGKLGLLLAIPPGYATAIWPPSGIALAGLLVFGSRAWPGVLLGSFLVNIGVSLDTSTAALLLKSLAVATGIGVGAALQAAAGALLIRRMVGFPARLDGEREVITFLVLGGPLACLVNASWSVALLALAGRVSAENAPFTWWTWWVGDTIGVLTLTPLLLVWLTPGAGNWRRRQAVTLPLVATFTLSVALFIMASSWEQERIRRDFFRQADAVTTALQASLDGYLEVLQSTRDFQLASPAFGRQDFRAFVSRPLERHPGILALSWNPRVAAADRERFESQMRRQGLAGFRIVDQGAGKRLVPAARRGDYVPIQFIEPANGVNLAVVGYDVASDPVRSAALARARDSGMATATGRLHLVQASRGPGFLVFLPVYRQAAPPATLEARRRDLKGYLVGVFQLDELVAAALTGLDTADMGITVEDGDPAAATPLYASAALADRAAARAAGLLRIGEVAFAGRQWRLDLEPTADYLVRHRSWQAWSVLVAGLLFTSLLGAFLLVITGRAGRVEALVDERTRELAEANRLLREEVALRSEGERALQEKNVELAAASQAKDRFLATMSHELRTPLNAILGFTGTLLMQLAGPLNRNQENQLQTVQNSARHLLSLINDLLDLAQIEAGKVEIRREPTSCTDVVREVMDTLRPLADQKGLALEVALPAAEVVLPTDRRALSQIVINLVNNAIKFTDRGKVAVALRQHSAAAGPVTEIRVSDTGCGIRPEDQRRLFQAFTQLDSSFSRRHEGTGLGLHLSSRLAGLLGGGITCESEFGKGSVFTLELPG